MVITTSPTKPQAQLEDASIGMGLDVAVVVCVAVLFVIVLVIYILNLKAPTTQITNNGNIQSVNDERPAPYATNSGRALEEVTVDQNSSVNSSTPPVIVRIVNIISGDNFCGCDISGANIGGSNNQNTQYATGH